MAWLIRHEAGGYAIAEQHPIRVDGALFFSEADAASLTPEQAAILLNGATLKPGEYVALRPALVHTIKPGYYAADANGQLHWFEHRPQRYDGQWYANDQRSEPVTAHALKGHLERIPEPTDVQPTRYGSQQAHHTPLVGSDVLPALASAELVKRGIKPRKQLGFLLRRRHYTGTLLTTHSKRAFEALKDYRYEPAFTFEDCLTELLKYGTVRFETLSDDRTMVTIEQSKNLYVDRSPIQAVFGALLYASAMLRKERQ